MGKSGDSVPRKLLIIAGKVYSKAPSRSALDLARILAALNFNVDTIYYPALPFNSARVLQRWLLRELYVSMSILRRRNEVSLIIVHQMIAIMGTFFGRIAGKKVIVYVGGSIYENMHQSNTLNTLVSSMQLFLWRLQFFLVNLIVVPTKRLVSASKLEIYASKLCVAPTRLISNDLLQYPPSRISLRENIVGYVGRFEHEKGVDLLPKVVEYVQEKVPLTWLFVGDGSLRKRIQGELIGLSNRLVKFDFTGWVSNPDYYLRRIKLLLLPSRSEGLPNVVLEAMACGTPILATPVGAVPDMIKEAETGFLLTSSDPNHVAKRIVELFSKPELLEKVGINAYTYVKENFTYESALSDWHNIFIGYHLLRCKNDQTKRKFR